MTRISTHAEMKDGVVSVHFWSNLGGATGIHSTHHLTVDDAKELMAELTKALAKVPRVVSGADLGLVAA